MTDQPPTSPDGGLVLDVAVRRGTLDLQVTMAVAPGEIVAVVGPNGAGKSTLLGMVAGLIAPDTGTITLGGTVLTDTATGTHVPPADRRVGVVFQDYLLFGHMSVADNIAFGPRARGAGRVRARADATDWLRRVGLAEHADRRPGILSGGQQQRVALARALAGDPRCLLLDEPLSALDADTRGTARRQLRHHLAQAAGPVLIVTHEPLEALALADRLVVLEAGRVTQSGSPAEVARQPRSDWVARLVGINLLSGRPAGDAVAVDGGGTVHAAGPLPDGPLLLTVHPRSISLHRQRPTGSPRNVWQGTVEEVELAGDRVRVQIGGSPPLVAEVTAAAMAELQLADLASSGGQVWVSFKAADVGAYLR